MKKQRGVAAVPLLVMIASVAAFVVMGYFVYKQMYPTMVATNANVNVAVNANVNATANVNVAANTNTTGNVNAPELTPEEDAKVGPPVDWKTYVNTGYGYSFRYPKELTVESDSYGRAAEITEKMNAHFPVPAGNTDPKVSQPEFDVEVWNTTKDLQLYAESIRAQNSKASPLRETTVAGRTAYWFTTTDSYYGNGESRTLDSEFAFYFVALEAGKSAVIVWYPTEYADGSAMLDTFTFTK